MSAFNIAGVDIKTISSDEIFVLDTNILLFLHSGFYYPPAKVALIAQYSNFIAKLLSNGNKFSITTAAIQELLHVFEKKAHELYVSANGLASYSIKSYRSIASERTALKISFDRMLYQLVSNYDVIIECPIKLNDIDDFVSTLTAHRYDPMDFFAVAQCKRECHVNFISHDSDFRCDNSINIYYAV